MTRKVRTILSLLRLARSRHDHVAEINLEARLFHAMSAR